MQSAAELGFEAGAELASHTTFGVPAKAAWFRSLRRAEELPELRSGLGEEIPLILGGGSNVLFTKDIERCVLAVDILGLNARERSDGYVELEVGAGENWHGLTQYAVERGWGGLENLSLIPGKVGAAPMQNIGAYGVEVKECIESVEVFDWKLGRFDRISAADCGFGYRESIFKNQAKNRYVISRVRFVLSPKSPLRLGYGAIAEQLELMGVKQADYRSVSQAVMAIRRSKLPDPAELGNAGSFFKNPTVAAEQAEALIALYPDIPHYPQANGDQKLAAGWLIERAGWKGKRVGSCGVHDKQALVLVNYGGAIGREILELSQAIRRSVREIFGLELETEVNIY